MAAVVADQMPYEQQHEPRGCGAAVLGMIYGSFGLSDTQAEIWQRVARPGPWGAARTNTRLLAADARGRGLTALVLKAARPWPILQRCAAHGVRVILNHLLKNGFAAGHYSLMVGVTDEHVVVHDPTGWPNRRLSKAEMLDLWGPPRGRSEITGHVLVAVSAAQSEAVCQLCSTPIPSAVCCRWCRRDMPLQPAAVPGCIRSDCAARLWERLFCPWCDGPLFAID
jgi:ABC-type bacteriocin/lantibiotic exporter with double-glycine peptidase domain